MKKTLTFLFLLFPALLFAQNNIIHATLDNNINIAQKPLLERVNDTRLVSCTQGTDGFYHFYLLDNQLNILKEAKVSGFNSIVDFKIIKKYSLASDTHRIERIFLVVVENNSMSHTNPTGLPYIKILNYNNLFFSTGTFPSLPSVNIETYKLDQLKSVSKIETYLTNNKETIIGIGKTQSNKDAFFKCVFDLDIQNNHYMYLYNLIPATSSSEYFTDITTTDNYIYTSSIDNNYLVIRKFDKYGNNTGDVLTKKYSLNTYGDFFGNKFYIEGIDNDRIVVGINPQHINGVGSLTTTSEVLSFFNSDLSHIGDYYFSPTVDNTKPEIRDMKYSTYDYNLYVLRDNLSISNSKPIVIDQIFLSSLDPDNYNFLDVNERLCSNSASTLNILLNNNYINTIGIEYFGVNTWYIHYSRINSNNILCDGTNCDEPIYDINLIKHNIITSYTNSNISYVCVSDYPTIHLSSTLQYHTPSITFNCLSKSIIEDKNISISDDAFSIYPNPTKDNFTVNNAQGSMMRVMNTLGQVVMSENITNNSQVISTNNLKQGMYFVEINNNGKVSTEKLIVK